MSVKLVERIEYCHDCKFTKLKLHVCRQCQVVLISTVLNRTAKCCECHKWLSVEKEVKVRAMPGFAEWYVVQGRPDFDFICDGFTTRRRGVLAALEKRQQLTLMGFERS